MKTLQLNVAAGRWEWSVPAGTADNEKYNQHSGRRSRGVNNTIERGGNAARCEGLVIFIGQRIQGRNGYTPYGEAWAPFEATSAVTTAVDKKCEYCVFDKVCQGANERIQQF
jgi:hypothetical protein